MDDSLVLCIYATHEYFGTLRMNFVFDGDTVTVQSEKFAEMFLGDLGTPITVSLSRDVRDFFSEVATTVVRMGRRLEFRLGRRGIEFSPLKKPVCAICPVTRGASLGSAVRREWARTWLVGECSAAAERGVPSRWTRALPSVGDGDRS